MHDTDPSLPFHRMERNEKTLRALFDSICGIVTPSVICDVGAFNGDESYRFARALPKSAVYAFEASPLNYSQFFRNASRFEALNNFTCVHTAISDTVGTTAFNVLDATAEVSDWRRAANSLLPRTDGLSSTAYTVPCTTLDAYFADRDLDDHTFALWIDVEGALDRVLAGAAQVLERTILVRAELEWVELWQGQALANKIIKRFEDSGFALLGDTYIPHAYPQSDAVFVRRNMFSVLT